MGSVFGKLLAETPKYDVVYSAKEYEVRRYGPTVVAEVTYDPAEFKGDKDAGFFKLADYIGAFGNPKNTKGGGEKIAMTAPVITKGAGEKIAMTAPVVVQEGKGREENNKTVTMQFVLPSKYQRAEDAPRPMDDSVVIKEQPERTIAVLRFSGLANEKLEAEKLAKLAKCLERDGRKVVGEHVLARYNPPWTLPLFRTNEIMIPVE